MDEKKKKEMFFRIAAGLVLIPLTLYAVLLAPRIIFFFLILLLTLAAVREYIPLVNKNGDKFASGLIWVGAVIVPICFYFGRADFLGLFAFLLLFILFFVKMISASPVENVAQEISFMMFNVFLIPVLFSCILFVRDFDPKWLAALFIIIWASDTFAYFTGISIGKHKLIPRVSPGKTVEGLIGGTIGALIVAFAFNHYFLGIGHLLMLFITVDIIIAGVIGDLAESMLKRSAMVKDSGHVIPGHGGILDRFDSMLFAAPVLFFYLLFFAGKPC